MKGTIRAIADGMNIWDGKTETAEYRNKYLYRYAALPSTNIMVERSVKKAKLCQQTGKEEKNVSAYGIAGDGVTEMCTYQGISTTYPDRMKKRREVAQAKAKAYNDGLKRRAQATTGSQKKKRKIVKDYKEDMTRGPSLARNVLNHALHLEHSINNLKSKMGDTKYDERFKKTRTMLNSFDSQGSAARYSTQLQLFTQALGTETRESEREMIRGVSITAMMKGEIAWGNLRKHDGNNMASLKQECIARGLATAVDKLGWKEMIKLVKAQIRSLWIDNNRGQEVPEKFPHFKQSSNAVFHIKEKR